MQESLVWIGITVLCCIVAMWLQKHYKQQQYRNSVHQIYKTHGYRVPPRVPGAWPLLGHSIAFSRDPKAFIRNAHAQFGPLFCIRMGSKEIAVACDHTLKQEFFKSQEKYLSLYNFLDGAYFARAFTGQDRDFNQTMSIIKRNLRVDREKFIPKICLEIESMIIELHCRATKSPEYIDMNKVIWRLMSRISVSCFIDIKPTDTMLDTMDQFSALFHRAMSLSFLIPNIILNYTIGRGIERNRQQICASLDSEIETYRTDPKKRNVPMIRNCVDLGTEKDSGSNRNDTKPMHNKEIANALFSLWFMSTGNPSEALVACLVDLIQNPEYWKLVENELETVRFDGIDIQGRDSFLANTTTIMHRCILETARLHSHILVLNRKPAHQDVTLGSYYVGDVDIVSMCEPMMMVYENSESIYSDPLVYNPSRFESERYDSKHIMTWGSGIHMCPGKTFALWEIKIALALLIQNFELPDMNKDMQCSTNHDVPVAITAQHLLLKLHPKKCK